ncbi:hypothetical protein MES5069_1860002 [Mesorhizobium escarrei]|uniref:SDR family NAD(P)-dependent oxidoreductase n=1 Tax=Mesorhizobium escarrei TaxID=666018 RepID=A0ABN8JMZ4_9HYPH|nr:hypothetical protein MES5069_1860002 [Mesorhizobium escarrei]
MHCGAARRLTPCHHHGERLAMTDLSGIPVTIVGASRGLGRVLAETFHRLGAQVLIVARGARRRCRLFWPATPRRKPAAPDSTCGSCLWLRRASYRRRTSERRGSRVMLPTMAPAKQPSLTQWGRGKRRSRLPMHCLT